ncbi:nucleotidyltransferase domain-containing protein [Thermofilum sp.]|uniref:type VII toxin-antitoxin system MntA family adenylyltransferase antitoxin n=1 Tax=Thermofilum sp. TaxID=1961369 RepID=UPI00258E0105|nr:nucleotidyltransferase domain-containing protein [Thermofilum sp.]
MEIKSLVSQAWESLNKVKELVGSGVSSDLEEAALRWYLYSLHQNVLDALASLISEAGLRKPGSYAELAKPLAEKGLVSEWFVDEVARIARTRNLLAHAYPRVPREDLVEIGNQVFRTVSALLETIIKLAERLGVYPPHENVSSDMIAVFKQYPGIIAVLLFGSRARGDYRPDSDYDIAVLAEKPLAQKELEEIALKIAELLGVPADKVDIVDLQVAPNELLYKVIRDQVPLYVSDNERFKRWVSENYIRVLDEEESLKETYYVRLEKKLRQHIS